MRAAKNKRMGGGARRPGRRWQPALGGRRADTPAHTRRHPPLMRLWAMRAAPERRDFGAPSVGARSPVCDTTAPAEKASYSNEHGAGSKAALRADEAEGWRNPAGRRALSLAPRAPQTNREGPQQTAARHESKPSSTREPRGPLAAIPPRSRQVQPAQLSAEPAARHNGARTWRNPMATPRESSRLGCSRLSARDLLEHCSGRRLGATKASRWRRSCAARAGSSLEVIPCLVMGGGGSKSWGWGSIGACDWLRIPDVCVCVCCLSFSSGS